MVDNDSMVATRARRSNAGSRLKQLIELEEQSTALQSNVSKFITEDDENVNLLFQEDENDEEFYDNEVDNENLKGIDEEEDDEEEEEGEEEDDEDNEEDSRNGKRKLDTEVDGDDVLSDSDISLSESDESEGEKELQKQEKIKQRAQRKKQIIPAIKKAKTSTEGEKSKSKSKSNLITSESLLLSVRRSSSRSAAVENKQALLEKLKASEERRAQFTPVVRVKHVELTQEEKLAEAVETEKANILSLHQFQEQEVVKKERQRQQLLSKRKKLTDVVRLVSRETFITPSDEVEGARLLRESILAKLRKRPGRRKRLLLEQQLEAIKLPGEPDINLPSVKEEMEEKKAEEEERRKEGIEDPEKMEGIEIVDSEQPEEENSLGEAESEEKEGDSKPEENSQEPEEKSGELEKEPAKSTNSELKESEESENRDAKSTQPESISHNGGALPRSPEKTEKEESVVKSESEDGIVKEEDNVEVKEEPQQSKSVRFAEELSEGEQSRTATPIKNEDEVEPKTPTEIFEGPAQRVARNTVYLFDFENDYRLDTTSVKTYLFGKDSLLPASRRFKDLKTIFRIGQVENPYAIVKEEKDHLFEPVSELTEEDPIFDELKKLPRLGIKQEVVEDVREDVEAQSHNIVLKTEAPTGLILPNNNKKSCLISGTEVKYFDPSNGIPYSSVDTYKLLKQIEQGQVPWISLPSDMPGGTPIEFYFGSRDGSTKHAKGVPKGFDEEFEEVEEEEEDEDDDDDDDDDEEEEENNKEENDQDHVNKEKDQEDVNKEKSNLEDGEKEVDANETNYNNDEDNENESENANDVEETKTD